MPPGDGEALQRHRWKGRALLGLRAAQQSGTRKGWLYWGARKQAVAILWWRTKPITQARPVAHDSATYSRLSKRPSTAVQGTSEAQNRQWL
jgi:hypothetical protein